MPVNEQVVDSLTIENLKNVAGAGAFYAGLAMRDAVDHSRRINAISEAALGAVIKGLIEIDPAEALSQVKALTGDDAASRVISALTALGYGQQGVKAAQTTPPTTP